MKTSACRDETLKNHPNKMGTTPQHIHTIPIFCVLCLLVVCIGGLWKVVGRVLLCAIHVDVHGVCGVVGGCDHAVDWTNVKVLSNPRDYTTRMLEEAVFICQTRDTLNRDCGTLPAEDENLFEKG